MSSVRVIRAGKTEEFPAKSEESLLDVLRGNGVPVTAPCGGNGTCGKCRVTLRRGGTETSVLACQTFVTEDCEVLLETAEGGLICTDGTETPLQADGGRSGLGAAVDLGTTTVAVRLFDLADGREIGSKSGWNAQAPYGGDVITRCQFCMERENGLDQLGNLIRGQILDLIEGVCRENGRTADEVAEVFLAGNTVMQHIAEGLSPAGIAVAPFTPVTLFDGDGHSHLGSAALRYAPCVAGYVGGDITAGLLAAGLHKKQGCALFLDVGTNGEMALGGADGFLSCAVASGPAFEGAGITCGMASTAGSINHVRWNGREPELDVIGGGTPKGICGSGLLDLLAMLLELGLVDESGYLLPPDEAPEGFEAWLEEDEDGNGCFRLTDEVYFTAADVRQLQLAKAAVAAGISVLMQEAKVSFDEIDALVLAGGFGSHMSAESAVAIGMLPEALLEKIVCVGNSSLSGAAMALLSEDKRQELFEIQKKCNYLELSGSSAFNLLFPEHMTFDKEESPWN